MRSLPRLSLAFLALLAVSTFAVAQEDEAAFQLGMRKVQSAMKSRKWSRALDLLNRLLADHAARDYVRIRREEVVEIHKRALFRSRVKEPRPDDVVSGDVLSCDLSSGRLKIRYRPGRMDDFQREKSGLFHSVAFAGPYSVEIRGKSYPAFSRGLTGRVESPTIYACLEKKRGYIVNYGFEQTDTGSSASWVPARMVDLDTDRVIGEKEITLAKSGKPFRLKVKVAKTGLRALYNNKTLFSTRKPDDLFGYWGFSSIPEWQEIVVEGRVQPAWIQGLLDAEVQKHLKQFERDYDPKKELPSWLFTPPAGAKSRGEAGARPRKEKPLPGPAPTPEQIRKINRVMTHLTRDDYARALEALDRLGEGDISPAARAFLRGTCLTLTGDHEQALSELKKSCSLDPEFLEGHALLVHVAELADRQDEATDALRVLLEHHPRRASLHVALIESLVRAGRFQQAQTAHFQTRKLGLRTKSLDQLGRTITQALNGPNWGRVHQHRSAHYLVKSDIDRETCVQASRILEEAFRLYNIYLKRVKKDNRRFTVYLFAGEAGFHAYCENAMGEGHTHAAGLYSAMLQQLIIWNTPDRDFMMRVVRHEGFHQYLHRIMAHPPSWFDEGLAEYFETADYVNGKWHVGKVREDHLAALGKNLRLVPLRRFLYMPARPFYKDAEQNYAQAWALIHFLRHGPEKYRTLFEALFARLQEKTTSKPALDRVFGEVDLNALEVHLRSHLRHLRIQH